MWPVPSFTKYDACRCKYVHRCRLARLWGWIWLGDWLRNRSDRCRWQQRSIEPVRPRRPCRSAVKSVQCCVITLGAWIQCTSAAVVFSVQHSICSRRQPDRTENHALARRDRHVEPRRPTSARQHAVPTLCALLRPARYSMSVDVVGNYLITSKFHCIMFCCCAESVNC